MDGGQPRGILKNAEVSGDDTYLFCNVPEHHDLVSNSLIRVIFVNCVVPRKSVPIFVI